MEQERRQNVDDQHALREHVVALLRGGNAHMTFDDAVADFPLDRINDFAPHGLYSPWHLLEHIRLTQRDILDFIVDPGYKERKWPDDYWPDPDMLANPAAWMSTLAQYRADLERLVALASDPTTNLYAEVPWGTGQTLLREFLLVADHTAYHVGEFAITRQTMETWPLNRHEKA